ncbi:sigma-70 family RNA polymerase sigma factor [Streptomyces sp. NPDC127197]|uniref:sigma-70 family RNA polymerase sigma factor n=1 Tax=Streptomyces sp. NPDC127197 TaxID=3345388 RepID=UPI003631D49E
MHGGEKKRKKVPRQRGLAPGNLNPDGDLCPEARRQWDIGLGKVPTLRGLVYALTNAQRTHIDDVMSKVMLAFFGRLRSGPLEGDVGAYLRTITQREAWKHLEELRDRAEVFVGDETYRLEDPDAHISVNPASKVELHQAMRILREEFSEFQLKAFVLYEGYGLQAPTIASLLGGTATKASVRDAIRHARKKLRSEHVGVRLGIRLAEE